MSDSFSFTLHSPLTDDEWDMITDVDFEHTNEITFYTKHGKEVRFFKASADVAPVRHGRWIDETFSFSRPRCSVCGELCIGLHAFSYVLTDYCPHCGARMDGDDNAE